MIFFAFCSGLVMIEIHYMCHKIIIIACFQICRLHMDSSPCPDRQNNAHCCGSHSHGVNRKHLKRSGRIMKIGGIRMRLSFVVCRASKGFRVEMQSGRKGLHRSQRGLHFIVVCPASFLLFRISGCTIHDSVQREKGWYNGEKIRKPTTCSLPGTRTSEAVQYAVNT